MKFTKILKKIAYFFESEKNKLTYDTEIEAMYLAGNFSAKARGGFEKA
ncbi:MAG: hypothetical protein L6V93_18005 [Clostridiales bacterium]|nr:MAG: hypothetical protein L6V93_18005 [Clostridiales bacterium]